MRYAKKIGLQLVKENADRQTSVAGAKKIARRKARELFAESWQDYSFRYIRQRLLPYYPLKTLKLRYARFHGNHRGPTIGEKDEKSLNDYFHSIWE